MPLSLKFFGPYAGLRAFKATCLALIGLGVTALGGCASLPSSGPEANQIVRASEGPGPVFRIIDLTSAAPAEVAASAAPDLNGFDSIAQVASPAAVDQIAVGDSLQVTVFEVGAALFGGGTSGGGGQTTGIAPPTANAQALPPAPVGPDGAIVVPYVGRVEAAGRSPAEVAHAIEAGLRGKSQSPQVVVTVREDQGNTVVLIGDVKSPGRKLLSYRRESLLDMIAIAGGPTGAKPDTIVRITRNGRSVEARLGEIQSGSPEDVTLSPQDRVELILQPRSFTAFGATGKVSEIPFQSVRLSLAEALARMGGPLDAQADATGVFLFRADQVPTATPIVYRLDLKNPRGYFIAQDFPVHDKDLILIANSPSNAWYKFLSIVNTITSPIVTARYLAK